MKWVVNKMVLPCLCLVSKSHVALLAYGSIPDVGSSKMTNWGLATNAIPTLQGTQGNMFVCEEMNVVTETYSDF